MLQETLTLLEADPSLSKPQLKMNGDKDEFLSQGMGSLSAGEFEAEDLNSTDEGLQSEELREARVRAAQMEKTMRWWSDCTANWRDKWAKVKAERNKARDEIKALKVKLDAASQEICQMKRDRNELSHACEENAKLKRDVERMEAELRRDRRAFVPPLRVGAEGSSSGGENNSVPNVTTKPESLKYEEKKNYVAIRELKTEGKRISNLDLLKKESGYGDRNPEGRFVESAAANQITLGTKTGGNDEREVADDDIGRELIALKKKLENVEKEVSEEKRYGPLYVANNCSNCY